MSDCCAKRERKKKSLKKIKILYKPFATWFLDFWTLEIGSFEVMDFRV